MDGWEDLDGSEHSVVAAATSYFLEMETRAGFRTLDMVRKFMQLEKATDTLIPAGPGSIAAGQRLAGSQVEL